MFDSGLLVTIGLGVLGLVLLLVFVAFTFKKAPTNQAFVISGIFPKIYTGKGSFVLPFLQRRDIIALETFPVDVKTGSAIPTKEYLPINVDANVVCRVGTTEDMLKLASQNFLNRDTDFIANKLNDVIEGGIRSIVGQMPLQEMISNKEHFAAKVQENVVPDLKSMGIEVVSFTVQDFYDESGIITSLGVEYAEAIKVKAVESRTKATAQKAEFEATAAKKKAAFEADANIEAAKQDARVKAERAAANASALQKENEAQIAAKKEIAIKENELLIKESKLKEEADREKATANAAYGIKEQEQRKQLEKETAAAEFIKQEQAVLIRKKEAEVEEQRLAAEIKKTADAAKYKREQEALAAKRERELEADAKLIEAAKLAESIELEAKARANARKLEGLAEADAIAAIGRSEAEAIAEKAKAMELMKDAAVLEMMLKVLPEMASAVSAPMAAIDSVQIFGGDANGVSGMTDNVPVVMAKTFESVKAATGVDMRALVNAPVETTRNLNVDINKDLEEVIEEVK